MSDYRFVATLHLLGIQDLLPKIIFDNPSAELPYHNSKHMYDVARIANELFDTNNEAKTLVGASKKIDDERRDLLVAALWHDYNHSGGKRTDSENIERAVVSIPDQFVNERVVRLIRVTEFPFIHEPVTVSEKCLRDADLLYATLAGDPKVIMDNLRFEIQTARRREITYREMLDGQRVFIDNAVLYTGRGMRVWQFAKEKFYDSLKAYARE